MHFEGILGYMSLTAWLPAEDSAERDERAPVIVAISDNFMRGRIMKVGILVDTRDTYGH